MNLNPPIDVEDLDRTQRVGPKHDLVGKPRPLLVKFATYRTRNCVFKARANLRLSKPPQPQVFVNEDLSKSRARLLWSARQQKHQSNRNDCWSADGRILVKNKANKMALIQNENDLMKQCS